MQTAYNPETGDTLVLVDNQWVKPEQIAKNDAGEAAYLIKNQWMLPGQESKPAAPTGMIGQAVDYLGDQANIIKKDIQVGLINTELAAKQAQLAEKMNLQEGRIGEFGPVAQMPEAERKKHTELQKSIEKDLLDVAKLSTDIRGIQATGGRKTTEAFQSLPQQKEYQEGDFWKKASMTGEAFIKDPLGIATDIGLQSLPQSLAVAATAVAARIGQINPKATAAAGGASSAMAEFGGIYADLREQGIPHKEAWEQAGVKSGVIGLFDAASFYSAGSAMSQIAKDLSKGSIKGTAKEVTKEIGKQSALGASGEALGSTAINQAIDPVAVLSEAVGEVFGAPGEAIATYRGQPKAAPTAPPTPAPGVVPPATPVEIAPPSLSQDTEAMIAELMGQPPIAPPEIVAEKQQTEAAPIPTVAPISEPINKTTQKEQPAPTQTKVEPVKVDRLKEPEVQASLQRYAGESGWAEIGGRLLRENAEDNTSAVIGRTRWTPNANWWTNRPVNLKGDINGRATQSAVNKALRGDKLTPNEKKMVDFLVNMHDTDMTEGDRLRAEMEERDRQVAEFNKQFEVPAEEPIQEAPPVEAAAPTEEDIQADMDARAAQGQDMIEEAKARGEIDPEIQFSKDQVDYQALAQNKAKNIRAGKVEHQEGDLAVYSSYNQYGGPNYHVSKGNTFWDNPQLANLGDPALNQKVNEIIRQREMDAETLHRNKPFLKFTNGLAVSDNFPKGISNVVRGWKNLLGIKANIYLATFDDALANKDNYTGPHREINGTIGLEKTNGVMKQLPNGDYFIVFKGHPSRTYMLETMAHELGHVHEYEVFKNAGQATQQALRDAFNKWLATNKPKNVRGYLDAMRAYETSQRTKVANPQMAATQMTAYWRDFSEWYADQMARWATSSAKPLSVVEKFFKKLADALKRFYSSIKGAGYLPNETFAEYINKSVANLEFEALARQKQKGQMALFSQEEAGTKTDTPQFKRWSKNSPYVSSQNALNYNFQTGKPFVAQSYHGTNAENDFSVFDMNLGGKQTAAKSAELGIFSTNEPKVAENYAKNLGFGKYLKLGFSGIGELNKNPNVIELQKKLDKAQQDNSKAYYDGITEIVNNLDEFFPKDLLKNHSKEQKRFLAQTLIDHPNFSKIKENFKNTENKIFKAEQDLKNYIFEFESSQLPQRIMPLYVQMSNPKVYDANGKTPTDFSISDKIAEAQKQGHDGVVFKNIADPSPVAVHYVSFKPNQIKSAIGNTGEYNPEIGDIRYSKEEVQKRLPPGRSAELTAAAQKLESNELTPAEYDELVNMYNPIRTFDKVPEPATKAKMYEALDSGKRDKIDPKIEGGHKVGLRLDIPAARKGAAVVSIHQKRTPSSPGASMGYTNMAVIKNVTFGIGNEKKALEIASGKAKDALQTIEGEWVAVDPSRIKDIAEKYFTDPEWSQVGIDPTRHSYFYDRKTTQPVVSADGVIQIGNFVLAKNVKYAPKSQFLYSKEEVEQTPAEKAKHRNIDGMIVSPTWNGPEVSKVDNLLYRLQDKHIDTKRVIQAIQKEAGQLDDKWNVYLKEELYHGRTSAALRKFLLQDLMPTIKEMSKLGVTPDEMKEYLHNRHAKERNDQIAKIRPETLPDGSPNPAAMTDKGSGLSYKQIENYFDKLDSSKSKKLEQVAKDFDKMIAGTQNILVTSGAEKQETIDAWNKTYKHYVPLFRVDDDFATHPSQGTGAGFSSSGGASKRATGSEKEVQDILGNILAQRERALIKAEKIRVGQALYGLAIKNPNPEFWLPINPDAIKNPDALAAELDSMGLDGQDVTGVMEEMKKPEVVMDRQTGLQTVRYKINPLERYKDNVFPVRVNGNDRYIFFNTNDPRAKRMVEAMKNLDTEQLGSVLGLFGKFTRWFSAVNTQYNPVFGGINFLRDVGGAQFNLSTTKIAGKQGAVNAAIFPAMNAIRATLKAERNGRPVPQTEMTKMWDDLKTAGGQTLYRDSLVRKAEEKQLIEHELNKLKRGVIRKSFSKAVQLLSDFNDTIENAVRLSAYKVAIDNGLSKEQAASIAKNLTVNFDRKGQIGSRINALWAFFNASMQGSARLMETLRGPQGRKIIAGGILLGVAQSIALAMAGFDEDEPPEFLKERNLIIPVGGKKYILIPMPLGLHFIPTIGRVTTDFVLNGGKDAGKHMVSIVGTGLDAFNPLGGSGLSFQTIAPTVLDPLAALEANKDAFGRPIYRADRATNPTPGYSRSRESASTINKYIAEFLNYASGGTKYQKGAISPTADSLDYLVGQFTGGVGREAMKVQSAVKSAVTGEELPSYRIPIAGRFYGDADSKAADSQRFYDNVTKIASLENEINGRKKNREDVAGFMRDNPQARLWQAANSAENQISELNRRKKDFQERGLPRDRILAIDNQKQVIMRRFNDRVKELEK